MIDVVLFSVLSIFTPYFEDLGFEVFVESAICSSTRCYDEFVNLTDEEVYFTYQALNLTKHDKYGLNMIEHAFWHVTCKCNFHEGDDQSRSNKIYPDEVS